MTVYLICHVSSPPPPCKVVDDMDSFTPIYIIIYLRIVFVMSHLFVNILIVLVNFAL